MSKLYLNIDSNTVVHPFLNRVSEQKNFCKEMLYPMVDMYRNLGVTDLMFNTLVQISCTKSDFWTDKTTKFYKKEEKGFAVDYSDDYGFAVTFDEKLKLDYFSVWFDRCRQVGINPWLSLRMNDCHAPFDKTSNLRSDFHYEAEHNGWILGDDYGYFRICLNYKVDEVRNQMLSYIREQISRYDVYGLELDFMREINCFKYLTENMDECRHIMTSFMAQVRSIVNDAEDIHGHKIKILVRLPRDIEQCKMLGFDPEAWSEKELVDIINPTPRFRSNDSGMPIDEWKEKLPNVKITAGIETLLSFDKNIAIASAEICTGLAASFLASGSDGIYLYNFFCDPDDVVEPEGHPYARNIKTIRAVSEPEKIYDYPIRFAVINQEDNYIPEIAYTPIPIILDNENKEISVCTGNIPSKKIVSLIIGYKMDEPTVYVNGCKIDQAKKVDLSYIPGIGLQPKDYVNKDTICLRYLIPNECLKDLSQEITFECKKNCEVNWIEIDVI